MLSSDTDKGAALRMIRRGRQQRGKLRSRPAQEKGRPALESAGRP